MSSDRIVIVGGGHAGTEAAAIAAASGAETILVTHDPRRIGAMSCNPSIGGVGKGHIVRELDVFGGVMPAAADAAAIHYRMLNASKGPAVRGPRVQADRRAYAAAVRGMLARLPTLSTVAGEVARLKIVSGKVRGVILADGAVIGADQVVLTAGTFLAGRIFQGKLRADGGRLGESAAGALAEQLRGLGLPMSRMKTGTPPRLDGRTIDWSRLERQKSDEQDWTMTLGGLRRLPQLACAITRTNHATHDVIRAALNDSPLADGSIVGPGPRYCPSIEDKVQRFGDRDGHQVFLEPEGLDDALIYPNGISTSLDADTQLRFVRTMDGLEQAEIRQAGYAVEYDHIDPRVLGNDLQVRDIGGLFLAGQVNGTTGYEEAAGQGMVAGLNAAARPRGLPAVIFSRNDSYLGVMVDDLTLNGVTEPYRMLTARAERRLYIRADNAFDRLGKMALSSRVLGVDTRRKIEEYSEALSGRCLPRTGLAAAIAEQHEADELYRPYIKRMDDERRRARETNIAIPDGIAYSDIAGLSIEMKERLERARPANVGQLGRIRGITPAAVTAVLAAARGRC